MSELHHECGIAAVYHLPGHQRSKLCPSGDASQLLPRMLLDIQNRGQLSAGITTFNPERPQLIDTHKGIGSVTEVFRLAHRDQCEPLMQEYAGPAGIGHVRYATCALYRTQARDAEHSGRRGPEPGRTQRRRELLG